MVTLDLWELNKYKVHQIDSSLTKRNSKWILVCSLCQHERIGTYCQAWNIIKNKSSGNCKKCIPKNISGFKRIPWNKGIKYTRKFCLEQSRKMKLIHSFGHNFVTEEGKRKQRLTKLGKTGEQTNAYIDGRTPENKRLRASDKYKQLRKLVFKRDNFTCQICFKRGGKLEMDHIKEWCNYSELRFDSNNCRTLCKSCHEKTPNYKTKAIKR